MEKKENDLGVKTVKISELTTVQPLLQGGKLKSMISNKDGIDTSEVPVVKFKGKLYIADGNHRVVASKLIGKKEIKVHLHKLDN